MVGFLVRAVANRARDCGRILWASLIEQLGELATDPLVYVDLWLAPFGSPVAGTATFTPGQSLVVTVLGCMLLRQLRRLG